MRLEGRWSHDIDPHGAYCVRRQKQRKWLNEMHDLNTETMLKFIKKDDPLIVPKFDSLVLASSGNQTEIVRVRATYDIFLVCVGFTSFDQLPWL